MKNFKIVKFGAPWCGPCKIQDKILDEMISEGYEVEKVNVDEDEDRATKNGILSVPTTIIYCDDEEVKRFVGLTQKKQLMEVMK